MSSYAGYMVIGSVVYGLTDFPTGRPYHGEFELCGKRYRAERMDEAEPYELRRAFYASCGASTIERIREAFRAAGVTAENPYHPDNVGIPDPLLLVAKFERGELPGADASHEERLAYAVYRHAMNAAKLAMFNEFTIPGGKYYRPEIETINGIPGAVIHPQKPYPLGIGTVDPSEQDGPTIDARIQVELWMARSGVPNPYQPGTTEHGLYADCLFNCGFGIASQPNGCQTSPRDTNPNDNPRHEP